MSENETSRRNVIYGVAAAGVALPVLAACGAAAASGGTPGGASGGSNAGAQSGGSTGSDSGSGSGSGSGAASGDTFKTSDIPVGGGTIFTSVQIVVTQPTAGDFKAFSAVCTHQGCLVSSVSDGTIDCACHGSMYSISTGAVEGGPAPSPLPEKKVVVSGATLTVT